MVQLYSGRGESHAALLDFSESGAVESEDFVVGERVDKVYRFLHCLEGRLAEEDGTLTFGWTFNDVFGFDPTKVSAFIQVEEPSDSLLFRHPRLNRIDIQRPRRQVINMRSPERHDIRHQAMRARKLVVRLFRNPGVGLPAECLQCVMDECEGVAFREAALHFSSVDQLHRPRMENLSSFESFLCDLPNPRVRDQLGPQQARKHPKRVDRQGFLGDGSERGRVYGQARGGEVVVVYGVHGHQGEQAAEGV